MHQNILHTTVCRGNKESYKQMICVMITKSVFLRFRSLMAKEMQVAAWQLYEYKRVTKWIKNEYKRYIISFFLIMSHIVSSGSQPMESHRILKHFPIHGKDLSHRAVSMDKTDACLQMYDTVWGKKWVISHLMLVLSNG